MTKKEWLKLPYLVRLWRVLFCKHPFDHSEVMKKVVIKDHTEEVGDPEFEFVVTVRRCGKCRTYFIDQGLEHTALGRAKWDRAFGRRR